MPALHILPVGLIDPDLVRRLAAEIPRRFAAAVLVEAPMAPPAHWKAAPGARFSAPTILRDLVAQPPTDGGWRLILLDGELVAPGVRSSCGFATIGGCCAVVALAPLAAGPHGPGEPDPIFPRLLVEAVHEIGHLAGLGHCLDAGCVMHFSTDAAAAWSKSADFCANCRARAGAV